VSAFGCWRGSAEYCSALPWDLDHGFVSSSAAVCFHCNVRGNDHLFATKAWFFDLIGLDLIQKPGACGAASLSFADSLSIRVGSGRFIFGAFYNNTIKISHYSFVALIRCHCHCHSNCRSCAIGGKLFRLLPPLDRAIACASPRFSSSSQRSKAIAGEIGRQRTLEWYQLFPSRTVFVLSRGLIPAATFPHSA